MMSPAIRNVVVAGASGSLGPHVLSALHASDFHVSALTRSAHHSLPSYVSVLPTDYSLESLAAAFRGQDAVISCVGVAGLASQITMIDAAERAGVKRFVPSEWGWAPDRPVLDEVKQRLAEKEKVMQHLVQVCGASRTMSWTAVATGPFLDWALLKAPALGFDVHMREARIIDGGTETVTASTGATIGKAAASILNRPEESANRFLKVHSVVLTQQGLLSALSKATGTEWAVKYATTADVVKHRAQMLEQKQFIAAFIDVLGQQLFEAGTGRGRHINEIDSDNSLLEIHTVDLYQTVAMLLQPA